MPNRFIRALQRATANEPYKHRERYWKAKPVKTIALNVYNQERESARRRRQIERGSLKAENGLEI